MMRILIMIFLLVWAQSCGNERQLFVHEKEYEFLEEIEQEKRTLLKNKCANLAVNYAKKKATADSLAQVIVDACSVEIDEAVRASAEMRSAERGAGQQQESSVDDYLEQLEQDLRKRLFKEVVAIINSERAK